MKKVSVIRSMAAPWLMPNIDTDILMPMGRVIQNYDELERYALEPYRYLDADKGEENPEFPLNQPQFRGAKILIAGMNFGCGSTREEAVVGIAGLGIECIIAESFGGIFMRNCYQKCILPIILPPETVELLARKAKDGPFEVSLPAQTITVPDGDVIPFAVDLYRRGLLLEGLDDVGHTLQRRDIIDRFSIKDRQNRPWIYI